MNFTSNVIALSASFLVFYSQIQVSWSKANRETVQMTASSPGNQSSDDANQLNQEGIKYYTHGYRKEALALFEKELIIRRAIQDRRGEATALDNIALIYRDLGNKQKAIDLYGQALFLSRAALDRGGEAYILNGIGALYDDLGQKEKAIGYYNQSLLLMKAENDFKGEALTLRNIAALYRSIGKRQKAIEVYEQALPLIRDLRDYRAEASVFGGMGLVYSDLGDEQKALEYHNQSLAISRSIHDRSGEATALSNIGRTYRILDDKQRAIEYYSQALILKRSLPDPRGEANILNGIGLIYAGLGENTRALEYFTQSLPIMRSVMDPDGEATALNNIASISDTLGDKQKALECYNQALTLMQSVDDRSGEATTFLNIAFTLSRDSQPELAIVFYKQSIDIIESLRADIKGLPKSTQRRYAQSVTDSYRALADLLLKENRVLEAEQVLDLLKIQELDDSFRGVQGNATTQKGVIFLRQEQIILDKYYAHLSAVQIGNQRRQTQSLSRSGKKLSSQQQKELIQSDKIQTEIKGQFNQFINSPDIKQISAQLTRTGQDQIPLEVFDKLRSNLRQLGNAALVYPLILDDRLELIITTPDSPPLRRTVKVSRAQINQAIIDYRDALEDSTLALDPRSPAQKLYRSLIQPLEADLTQANIKTIIYAPDGPLRYIPLAALYDGKQWIAQKYAVNSITAASLSDLNASQPTSLRLLAGAFANEKLVYKVQVVQQKNPLELRGLPFAGKEVNDIAAIIPSTNKKIDQAFSLEILKPSFGEYNILHFATHSTFFPGNPEDSFILFGDGERATLRSIDDWSLSGVDLVVLSSCESGLGIDSSPNNPKPSKSNLGNGSEILGLGYQFQKAGARATIASLWSVDDGGTQHLMSAFYNLLKQGNITKTEALRQAQVALITGKGKPQSGIKDLTHPHYWAPFFLIGNGL
jgi:CHAT domain-containing protein/Tfp pilus assembly protein PilF